MQKMLIAGVLAICLAACNSHPDNIVGTYGVSEHGTVTPLLKVESDGENYTVSEYRAGKWAPVSETVKPFAKADLEQLTKHKVDVPVGGIQTNAFALVNVPKGWTDGGFTTKTGYFVFMLFGPVEVQKL